MGVFNPQRGQIRWLKINAIPLFDPGSEAPVQVYATFNDITDVISTERELTRAQHELNESERIAHAALDALTAQVAILDESGAILMVNKSWRDFVNENGAMAGALLEGANYLQACDCAQGNDAEEASVFAKGLRAVIRGERELFKSQYLSHSPQQKWLFTTRITRMPGDGPLRIVIVRKQMAVD